MKERPILFSAPMVRAILAGAKTQTRRVVKPGNSVFGSAGKLFWSHAAFERAWVDGRGSGSEYLHVPCHRGDEQELARLDAVWLAKGVADHGYRREFPDCSPCEVCDRGWRMTSHRLYSRIEVGNRLWVRETWRYYGGREYEYQQDRNAVFYRAAEVAATDGHLWRTPIFMPRWASRIDLDVTGVRVERLQEISETDAKAEGAAFTCPQCGNDLDDEHGAEVHAACDDDRGSLVEGFRRVWTAINGDDSWAADPWVWVIEFRRVERDAAPVEARA